MEKPAGDVNVGKRNCSWNSERGRRQEEAEEAGTGVPRWELCVSDGLKVTAAALGGSRPGTAIPAWIEVRGFVLPCGDHLAAGEGRRRMRGKLWGSAGGRSVGMELEAELGQGCLWLLEDAGSCGISWRDPGGIVVLEWVEQPLFDLKLDFPKRILMGAALEASC